MIDNMKISFSDNDKSIIDELYYMNMHHSKTSDIIIFKTYMLPHRKKCFYVTHQMFAVKYTHDLFIHYFYI